MSDPVVQVAALTKHYGSLVAVDSLSFDLAAGQILGLVGPNGAGKTTTLRAIAGIHPPTSGRIAIGGIDLKADPVGAKRQLAFMPDEPRLFDYLTVDEHLQFVARLYQIGDARPEIDALLREFELGDKRKAFPNELSRGMKQKLMIACGFVHAPRLLIFDEPLTGLDPLGIRRMKESIIARARAGAAVILSSHLLHLVEELCDTVLVIQHGKRIAFRTIEELKHDASLEDAFLRMTSES